MILKQKINLMMWNIEGLTKSKVSEPHFLKCISDVDILSFVETWNDGKESHNIQNFQYICSSSRKKHVRAKRHSGGISIYVNHSISKGVCKLKSTHSDIQWIKLDQTFFNFPKDVYLAIVYISPQNSTGNVPDLDSVYACLISSIEHFSKLGDVVLQGDFNAYTNTSKDFVSHDESRFQNSEDHCYVSDTCIPRNNSDQKQPNSSGKYLLDLCKETGLRIINGRKIGDLFGKCTCYTYNGCSLVDYTIASIDLLQSVQNFCVNDFTPFSNHCPITCTLNTSFNCNLYSNDIRLDPLPGKFIWNTEALNLYSSKILSNKYKEKINNYLEKDPPDCEEAVNSFNSILTECASESTKFVKQALNSKKKSKPNKPWFSQSCRELRNTVLKYCKLISKFPSNGSYRKSYYSFRSKYRRLCKYEEKKFRENICNNILTCMDSDPKTCWNLINKLTKDKKDNEIINKEDFTNFFIKLNKTDDNHSEIHEKISKEVESKLHEMNVNSDQLSLPIEEKEILKAVKTLKNGKSSALDTVSNEMIKYGISALIKPILKLFNFIFDKGIFPRLWNESLIVPIHKKGDKLDPSNYRGISITSNLGKLFNKVMCARLTKFVDDNNIISENQIGFKEKCRTADHIFTLKSITDIYKKKKKKVYAAFIDLKKAFDTIWRTGLFYILLQKRVPPKLLRIIYSMYQNTNCRVKYSNGTSKVFPSSCGVKQGDVLSPLLFNIFINGITDKLEVPETEPVVLGESRISALLYADDIVLLSSTPSGLQKSLDVLGDFCDTWKLKVNTDKSKIMVFNSNGKSHLNAFALKNHTLETVSSYCYLGIQMKYNGNFQLSIKALADKALKALFKIKKSIGLDNPCNLLEKLFDTLVVPILLYNCEVWGLQNSFKDSDPFEHIHLKFIKECLGVHYKSSNSACRQDLNRLPLYSRIQYSAVKYLLHMKSSQNTLVCKVLEETKNENPWLLKLKDTLNDIGFSFVLTCSSDTIKCNLGNIKTRIDDIARQNQLSVINSSPKLEFYRTVNQPNSRALYVDLLKNKSDRCSISKIRLSAHKLAIETGRYHNVTRDNRICLFCNTNQVEDEIHFLFKCQKYHGERIIFFDQIKNSIPSNIVSIIRNPWLIFDSESEEVLKSLSKYIKNCFSKREN